MVFWTVDPLENKPSKMATLLYFQEDVAWKPGQTELDWSRQGSSCIQCSYAMKFFEKWLIQRKLCFPECGKNSSKFRSTHVCSSPFLEAQQLACCCSTICFKKTPKHTIDGPSPPKTKALKIVSNKTSRIHLNGIHLEYGHTIRILFFLNAQEAAPWGAIRATPRPYMGSYYCRGGITPVNRWIHGCDSSSTRMAKSCSSSWIQVNLSRNHIRQNNPSQWWTATNLPVGPVETLLLVTLHELQKMIGPAKGPLANAGKHFFQHSNKQIS